MSVVRTAHIIDMKMQKVIHINEKRRSSSYQSQRDGSEDFYKMSKNNKPDATEEWLLNEATLEDCERIANGEDTAL